MSNLSFTLLGRKYKTRGNPKLENITENLKSVRTIAKKAKISPAQAVDYVTYGPVRYHISRNGDRIQRINLETKKPLLLKEFGVKNIPNKQVLKPVKNFRNKTTLVNSLALLKKINLHVEMHLFIPYWQNSLDREENSDNKDARRIITDIYINTPQDSEVLIDKLNDTIISKNYKYLFSNDQFILDNITEILKRDDNELESDDNLFKDLEPTQARIVKIIFTDISNTSTFKYDFLNQQLREAEPINICNLYANVDLNNIKDCARNYLFSKFYEPEYKQDILALGSKNGITNNEILQFTKKHKIQLEVFDITGTLRIKSIGTNKRLSYLSYNGHLYPINGSILKKRHFYKHNQTITILENQKDCQKKISSILKKELINPDTMVIGDGLVDGKINIISFIHDDVKYIVNSDYKICHEIATMYGLENSVNERTTLDTLFSVLSQNYIRDNINSFILHTDLHTRSPYNYTIKNNNANDNIQTIDRNCAYASDLINLPFLIVYDYITTTIRTKDITEIVDHYLYLIKPKEQSILIPTTGFYAGYNVGIFLKEKVSFEIIEEHTAIKGTNYYRKYYQDLYENLTTKYGPRQGKMYFKQIYTREIGCFEKSMSSKICHNIKSIYNEYEKEDHPDKVKLKITDDFYAVLTNELVVTGITNKIPISSQIKDSCRISVYYKAKELKLKTKDIIQIKTDSLSYYGPEITPSLKIGEWKREIYKPLTYSELVIDKQISNHSVIKKSDAKRVLYNCYAGCGKTFHIKNKLIPEIELRDEDYIVLTPSNKALDAYRSDKELNDYCAVVSKYTLSQTIPTEKNIIIDEFFMCNKQAHYLIIKCILLGKNIYCYGDSKQLLNPEDHEPLNSTNYINQIFTTQDTLTNNYRNDFSNQYYDDLCDGKCNNEEEIKKHSTKNYNDADVIICYRNDTVDKYNKLYMDDNGIEMLNTANKIICMINSKSLQEKNIYKGMIYYIDTVEGNKVTLCNGSTITIKQLYNPLFFKPAYALTLYAMQGAETPSFYFPMEDINYIDDRGAYTLISRLKTK
jgi:hypothetical protein